MKPKVRGLIIRQKEPSNIETPFDQIDSYLTPTDLFPIVPRLLRHGIRQEVKVKSEIARPAVYERLEPNRVYTIPERHGRARPTSLTSR